MIRLADLLPGEHFLLPGSGRTGQLLRLTSCRAYIRYHGTTQVTFNHKGKERVFRAHAPPTDIAPGTQVERIPPPDAAPAAERPKRPRKPRASGESKRGKRP